MGFSDHGKSSKSSKSLIIIMINTVYTACNVYCTKHWTGSDRDSGPIPFSYSWRYSMSMQFGWWPWPGTSPSPCIINDALITVIATRMSKRTSSGKDIGWSSELRHFEVVYFDSGNWYGSYWMGPHPWKSFAVTTWSKYVSCISLR